MFQRAYLTRGENIYKIFLNSNSNLFNIFSIEQLYCTFVKNLLLYIKDSDVDALSHRNDHV